MQSTASTVAEYIRSLPEDRRVIIEAVRRVFLANIDPDIEEGMGYGMISYHLPHRVYPAGYHCNPADPLPYAGLASQKNHLSLYLMSIYGDSRLREWFVEAWRKTGKKLDMGKACIRFKKLEDLPLEVLAEALRRVPSDRYIAGVEAARQGMASSPQSTRRAPDPTKADDKPTGKAAAQPSPATTAPTRTAPTRTAPTRTAPTRTAPTKPAPTRPAPSKKSPVKQSTSQKSSVTKAADQASSVGKRSAEKKVAVATPTVAKKPPAKKSPVRQAAVDPPAPAGPQRVSGRSGGRKQAELSKQTTSGRQADVEAESTSPTPAGAADRRTPAGTGQVGRKAAKSAKQAMPTTKSRRQTPGAGN